MFSIHPHDLQVRRKRCTQFVSALQKHVLSSPNACNICGNHDSALLAGAERYGLRVRTVMCRNGGLIYLADRDRRRHTSYRVKRRMLHLADALGVWSEGARTVPVPERRPLDPAANLTIPQRSGESGS
jgi:hypothetical protein